jgi:hypothetical protein
LLLRLILRLILRLFRGCSRGVAWCCGAGDAQMRLVMAGDAAGAAADPAAAPDKSAKQESSRGFSLFNW